MPTPDQYREYNKRMINIIQYIKSCLEAIVQAEQGDEEIDTTQITTILNQMKPFEPMLNSLANGSSSMIWDNSIVQINAYKQFIFEEELDFTKLPVIEVKIIHFILDLPLLVPLFEDQEIQYIQTELRSIVQYVESIENNNNSISISTSTINTNTPPQPTIQQQKDSEQEKVPDNLSDLLKSSKGNNKQEQEMFDLLKFIPDYLSEPIYGIAKTIIHEHPPDENATINTQNNDEEKKTPVITELTQEQKEKLEKRLNLFYTFFNSRVYDFLRLLCSYLEDKSDDYYHIFLHIVVYFEICMKENQSDKTIAFDPFYNLYQRYGERMKNKDKTLWFGVNCEEIAYPIEMPFGKPTPLKLYIPDIWKIIVDDTDESTMKNIYEIHDLFLYLVQIY